ncbi:MAG TPA: hypothetical protein VKD67_05610 [Acidimicrobiales bacterium]|nr:hypothetical protein [Acidimicrobiales bacterium]
MLKFKMGALLGFAAGWAVGSGRASEFWDQVQRRASTSSRPVPVTNGAEPYDSPTLARDGTVAGV